MEGGAGWAGGAQEGSALCAPRVAGQGGERKLQVLTPLWERTLDSGLSSFGAGGLRLYVRSPEGWAGAVLTRAMRGARVWERVAV